MHCFYGHIFERFFSGGFSPVIASAIIDTGTVFTETVFVCIFEGCFYVLVRQEDLKKTVHLFGGTFKQPRDF